MPTCRLLAAVAATTNESESAGVSPSIDGRDQSDLVAAPIVHGRNVPAYGGISVATCRPGASTPDWTGSVELTAASPTAAIHEEG
jgi:hypothetical protein